MSQLSYQDFLARKVDAALGECRGFDIEPAEINPLLKPHQRDITMWAIRKGRGAIFAAFGLGKTFIQLEIARLIVNRIGGKFLIVAPLGVRQEFIRDGIKLGIDVRFIRRIEDCLSTSDVSGSLPSVTNGDAAIGERLPLPHSGEESCHACAESNSENAEHRATVYITNYETIRDGKLDPTRFAGVSLDEASILRGFGGTKTFRAFMQLFEGTSIYRFVATATPSPNDYIELLAYAAFLGIMDVGQAKTRFFKRDSTNADNLTLHPHKEREFWLWVASWAVFVQKPSDLGYSDEGYELPPLDVHWHEIASDHSTAVAEPSGQGRLLRNAAISVTAAASEKRDSLDARIRKLMELRSLDIAAHRLIWHDLESEREAIEHAIPSSVSVYGAQDLDEREQSIADFSDGKIQELAAKPVLAGSGCNFQRHCSWAIFLGIGFKFNDFLQAIYRIQRFLQPKPVRIDLIYTEAEREVRATLERKWEQDKQQREIMAGIIQQYGLASNAAAAELKRSIGVERVEVSGDNFIAAQNDCVLETRSMAPDSVHLVLTSIPFSTQYEYTPSYNDFGHTDSNEHFWQQMDFLTPELLRVLKPGRVAAIHVKDRIVPSGLSGMGFQTVYPFSDDCIRHFAKHGFGFLARKTIVTDVVRENNQTYRLGWTEQCKDGSRMGAGMPEYLLLFRKPPTDRSNGYADEPVVKSKADYTRSRWQIDAHGYMRSSGNRLLAPEDLAGVPHERIFKLFRAFSLNHAYDYEHHVKLSESLEVCPVCSHIHRGERKCANGDCPCKIAGSRLPATFMLFQPQSWHPDVWTDITRMRTLNADQEARGAQMHLCPIQFDICDRVITQFSMPGDVVYDPFGGLMTVAVRAMKLGRYGRGCELNPNYFLDGLRYLRAQEKKLGMPSLFDIEAADEAEATA